jgi:hypothetical protein
MTVSSEHLAVGQNVEQKESKKRNISVRLQGSEF